MSDSGAMRLSQSTEKGIRAGRTINIGWKPEPRRRSAVSREQSAQGRAQGGMPEVVRCSRKRGPSYGCLHLPSVPIPMSCDQHQASSLCTAEGAASQASRMAAVPPVQSCIELRLIPVKHKSPRPGGHLTLRGLGKRVTVTHPKGKGSAQVPPGLHCVSWWVCLHQGSGVTLS